MPLVSGIFSFYIVGHELFGTTLVLLEYRYRFMDQSPKFKAIVLPVQKESGKFHYPQMDIPLEIADAMLGKVNMLRVIVEFDNGHKIHRALRRNKNGETFISLGKSTLKDAKQELREELDIRLAKDKSKFGFELPEEFKEVMYQDPEGKAAFMNLKPGMRRSFLYYVVSAKTIDTRIKRSLQIMENLKNGIISAGPPSRSEM